MKSTLLAGFIVSLFTLALLGMWAPQDIKENENG